MKRWITILICLLFAGNVMAADVKMSELTDGSATIAGTWYAIGYNSTTNYRFTVNSILALKVGTVTSGKVCLGDGSNKIQCTTDAYQAAGWIVQAGSSNILTYTGNYSLGLTLSGNTTLTFPTSGTLITTGNISDTAYDATSWDNVTTIAPSKNAVRDKFESQPLYTEPAGLQLLKRTSASNVGASGITDDGTTVDAGALHFATTGIISGKVGVITKSSAYTLGTDAAKEAYGYMMLATGAMVLTLPAGVVGMSGCALERDVSEALSVKPASGEQMVLNGTKLDANHKVTSASGAGDFVCYAVLETGVWYVLGKSGTWTDGAE